MEPSQLPSSTFGYLSLGLFPFDGHEIVCGDDRTSGRDMECSVADTFLAVFSQAFQQRNVRFERQQADRE
jgi:hypothetical protein